MDNRDMIAEAMEYVGITQSELAGRMGITQPTLSALIKYDKISVETMRRIADALGAEYISCFEFREGKKISSDDIVPKKEISQTESEKIKLAIKNAGLTQREVAKKININERTYYKKIEKNTFTEEEIQKINKILKGEI